MGVEVGVGATGTSIDTTTENGDPVSYVPIGPAETGLPQFSTTETTPRQPQISESGIALRLREHSACQSQSGAAAAQIECIVGCALCVFSK